MGTSGGSPDRRSDRRGRGRCLIALVVGIVVLVTISCSGAGPSDGHPAEGAGSGATSPPATVTSVEVADSTPTGDLAFLGPLRKVPVDDIVVGYRQFGSGPPLVLIAGQDSSLSYWGPDLLRRLGDRFSVTAFDNRGVGATSDPATEPLTIGRMADDTAGLIGALGLDQPTVFGWSTGGEIGLALEVRHPGVSGPLMVSGATAGGPESTPAPPELDALLASTELSDQIKLLDELFTPSGAAARDAYLQGLLSMPADPVSPQIEARQAEAEAAFAGDPSIADALGSITTPVLVTDGAADRLVPPANASLIADRIPGAQLVLVPDTSHGWMLQDSDRFIALLVAFSEGRPLPPAG